jgi:acetyl/propionyl-CoA carboxylase alpha subunit
MPSGPGVRIDTGVFPGFEISPYYDSLISKLIVWGETRAEAILRMRRALEEYKIVGVRTNIPFHQRLMDSHRFMGGQFDTRFIEERFWLDAAETEEESREKIAAIISTLVAHQQTQRAANIEAWHRIPATGMGRPLGTHASMKYKFFIRRTNAYIPQ